MTFVLQVTYWPGTHLPDPVALQLWLSDCVFPGSQLLPGPVHSVCWVADALVSNDGAIVVTNAAAIASIRTNVVLVDMCFIKENGTRKELLENLSRYHIFFTDFRGCVYSWGRFRYCILKKPAIS